MLNTIIDKINKKINILFVCSYTILLLADIMYLLPIIEKYNEVIVLFSYIGMFAFIIFKMVCNSLQTRKIVISSKRFAILGLIATIMALCYIFTKDATFIRLFLLASCVYFIDFDYFVKVDVGAKVTLIVSTIVLCALGFIPDQISYRADKFVRHSMGFKNPNLISLYLTVVVFEIMYLVKNKKIVLFTVAIIILEIVEYFVLNTKTTVLILPVGLLFYILYAKKEKMVKHGFQNHFIKKIIFSLPIILSFLAVISICIYNINPDIISLLNKLTSGRIEYCTIFYNFYGFSIFGNNIPDIIFDRYVLDNMYLKLLIKYGIVQFIVFIGILLLNTKKAYRNKRYDVLFFIVMLELYGIMESIVIIPSLNIFILYFISNMNKNNLVVSNKK